MLSAGDDTFDTPVEFEVATRNRSPLNPTDVGPPEILWRIIFAFVLILGVPVAQ